MLRMAFLRVIHVQVFGFIQMSLRMWKDICVAFLALLSRVFPAVCTHPWTTAFVAEILAKISFIFFNIPVVLLKILIEKVENRHWHELGRFRLKFRCFNKVLSCLYAVQRCWPQIKPVFLFSRTVRSPDAIRQRDAIFLFLKVNKTANDSKFWKICRPNNSNVIALLNICKI
jgi:hypothetical protein